MVKINQNNLIVRILPCYQIERILDLLRGDCKRYIIMKTDVFLDVRKNTKEISNLISKYPKDLINIKRAQYVEPLSLSPIDRYVEVAIILIP